MLTASRNSGKRWAGGAAALAEDAPTRRESRIGSDAGSQSHPSMDTGSLSGHAHRDFQQLLDQLWQRKPLLHSFTDLPAQSHYSPSTVSVGGEEDRTSLKFLPPQGGEQFAARLDRVVELTAKVRASLYRRGDRKKPAASTSSRPSTANPLNLSILNTKLGASQLNVSSNRPSIAITAVTTAGSTGILPTATAKELLSLLADLLQHECTLVTTAYREQPPWLDGMRPERPPFMLHRLLLDIAYWMVEASGSAEFLSQLGLCMLSAFDAFPSTQYHYLLRFFTDAVLPRMQQLVGANMLREDRLVSTRTSQAATPLPRHLGTQNGLNGISDTSGISESTTFHGRLQVHSESMPSVEYSTALLPPLLGCLLQFRSPESDEYHRLMEAQLFDRLWTTMLELRRDLPADLLELVAHGNNTVRLQALKLLFRTWPQSTGHWKETLQAGQECLHSFLTTWTECDSKCAVCDNDINGLVLQCVGCKDSFHIDCLAPKKFDYPVIIPAQSCTTVEDANFRMVSVLEVTLCARCTELIWGIHLQACQCQNCEILIHRHCAPGYSHICLGQPPTAGKHIVEIHWLRKSLEDFYEELLVDEGSMRITESSIQECFIAREIFRLQRGLLSNSLASGRLQVQESQTRELLTDVDLVAPKLCSSLQVYEQLLKHHGTAMDLPSFDSLGEMAILMKLPAEDPQPPKSPSKTEQDPQSLSEDDLLELLDLFPDQMDDAKMELLYGHDLLEWITRYWSLRSPIVGNFFLQSLLIHGFFARVDGSPVFETFKPVKTMQSGSTDEFFSKTEMTVYYAPIPHPLDPSKPAKMLIHAVRNCLLKTADLQTNEAALIFLTRRFHPRSWKEPVEDPGPSRSQLLARELLWILVSWLVYPEKQILTGAQIVDQEEQVRYLQVRKRLVETYVAPWMNALYESIPAYYEQALMDVIQCTSHDELLVDIHADNTYEMEPLMRIYNRIDRMGASGVQRINLQPLVYKWMDMVYKSSCRRRTQKQGTNISKLELTTSEQNAIADMFAQPAARSVPIQSQEEKPVLYTSVVFDFLMDEWRREFSRGSVDTNSPVTVSKLHPFLAIMGVEETFQRFELLEASSILLPTRFYQTVTDVLASKEGKSLPCANHMLRFLWCQIQRYPISIDTPTIEAMVQKLIRLFMPDIKKFVSHLEKQVATPSEAEEFERLLMFLRMIFQLTLYNGGFSFATIHKLDFLPILNVPEKERHERGILPKKLEYSHENVHAELLSLLFTPNRLMCPIVHTLECTTLPEENTGMAFAKLRERGITFVDVREDALRYLHILLNTNVAQFQEADKFYRCVTEPVLPVLWEYLDPQHDLVREITMDLLGQFLIYDCFRSKNLDHTDSGINLNMREMMKCSRFHACVHSAMESTEWETRLHGLDCVYGFFSKVDTIFLEAMDAHLWMFGPLVSYFVAGFQDESNAVRVRAMGYFRSLDSAHLDSLLMCWEAYFLRATDANDRASILTQMMTLNGMFPGLYVVDWGIVLPCCHPHPDQTPTAAEENSRILALSLALQMLGNGIEISREHLIELETELAVSLGFQVKDAQKNETGDWARLQISSGPFQVDGASQQAVAIALCRYLKRSFDKYMTQYRISTEDVLPQAVMVSPPLGSSSPVTTTAPSKLKRFARRFFPSRVLEAAANAVKSSTAPDDEKAEETSKLISTFFFFDLLTRMVESEESVEHMDSVLLKSWFDVINIYVYKYSLKEEETVKRLVAIMPTLLRASLHDQISNENKLMLIALSTILLQRAEPLTSTLLPHLMPAFLQIMIQWRYHRLHPLRLHAYRFLRLAVKKLGDSGFFVLLMRGEWFAALEKDRVLDTDLLYVLRSMVAKPVTLETLDDGQKKDPKQKSKEDAEEEGSDNRVKPIVDVIKRLMLFRDMEKEDVSMVMRNLNLYLDVAKLKTLDMEIVQGICKFLNDLAATRVFPWRKRFWDVNPFLDFCTKLLVWFPQYVKIFFPAMEAFFIFAVHCCIVDKQHVSALLEQLTPLLGEEEGKKTMAPLLKIILADARDMLRNEVRAEKTIEALLELMSETDGGCMEELLQNQPLLANDCITYLHRTWASPNLVAARWAAEILVMRGTADTMESMRGYLKLPTSLDDARRHLYLIHRITVAACLYPGSVMANSIVEEQELVVGNLQAAIIISEKEGARRNDEGATKPLSLLGRRPTTVDKKDDSERSLLIKCIRVTKSWLTLLHLCTTEERTQALESRFWNHIWPLLHDRMFVKRELAHDAREWDVLLDFMEFLAVDLRSHLVWMWRDEVCAQLPNANVPEEYWVRRREVGELWRDPRSAGPVSSKVLLEKLCQEVTGCLQ